MVDETVEIQGKGPLRLSGRGHIGGINSIHEVDCRLEDMRPGSFTEHVSEQGLVRRSPKRGGGGLRRLFEMDDGDFHRERSEAGMS